MLVSGITKGLPRTPAAKQSFLGVASGRRTRQCLATPCALRSRTIRSPQRPSIEDDAQFERSRVLEIASPTQQNFQPQVGNVPKEVKDGGLQQVAQDKDVQSQSGSVLGAAGLIVASSVGAGVLALPAVASEAGFVPTMSSLAASWLLMTMEALLIAEVNLFVRQQSAGTMNRQSLGFLSIPQMAQTTIGPIGGNAAKAAYVFLATTLLTAYTSKAGDVIESLSHSHLPATFGSAIFVAAIASFVVGNATERTEAVTRFATVIMLLLFAAICTAGAAGLDIPAISAYSDVSHLPAVIPVLVLSLVYHDLIPVLCDYLGGDARRVRQAVLVGGAVPPFLFALFCAVTLSMVQQMGINLHTVGADTLDPLRVVMQANPVVASIVPMFCLSAVFTSCVGATLSFSKFVETELHAMVGGVQGYVKRLTGGSSDGRVGSEADEKRNVPAVQQGKQQVDMKMALQVTAIDGVPVMHSSAVALILLPVLAISQSNPELFFRASQLAGGYGMMALYGLLPPLMAARVRSIAAENSDAVQRLAKLTRKGTQVSRGRMPQASFSSGKLPQLVPGQNVVLGIMFSAALCVGINQIALDSGLLPN